MARRRQKVLVVHRDRAEARLEEMSGHPKPGVDDQRIPPVCFAERPSQSPFRVRNQDEMDVVGHEAIGPASNAVPAALAGQEIAIELVVVVAEEYLLAPIAALGHVMRKARNGETRDAGHGPPFSGRLFWNDIRSAINSITNL